MTEICLGKKLLFGVIKLLILLQKANEKKKRMYCQCKSKPTQLSDNFSLCAYALLFFENDGFTANFGPV
jgi:hypothetical protein